MFLDKIVVCLDGCVKSARDFRRFSLRHTQIFFFRITTQNFENMSISRSPLNTELTRLLNVKYPIMLAGMGGISGKELVAAVSNAGGYGVWGSAYVFFKTFTLTQIVNTLNIQPTYM